MLWGDFGVRCFLRRFFGPVGRFWDVQLGLGIFVDVLVVSFATKTFVCLYFGIFGWFS